MAEPKGNPTLEHLQSLEYRSDLAETLGIEPGQLRFLLYSGPRSRLYREFTIEKRNGGSRTIRAPRHDLKELQRRLAAKLMEVYRPRSCVFGYIKGRNIAQNARVHRNRRWTLRVDLADFFPSIHFGRVFGMFMAMGIKHEVAVAMAQICCDDDGLPQGAPTSPVVSNLLCGKLDRRLSLMCRKTRTNYTRYCDDLVFSTRRRQFPPILYDHESGRLGPGIRTAINSEGFEINHSKTALRGSAHRQMVTGLVTNDFVNVPRHYVRSLRTLIYMCKRYGLKTTETHYLLNNDTKNRPPEKVPPDIRMIVRGKLEYVRSIKGDSDPVYQKLAASFAEADGTFTHSPPKQPLPVVRVLTEGETDVLHFESALRALQASGHFGSLSLRIHFRKGDSKLLSTLRELEPEPPKEVTLCVFDRDRPEILSKVTDEGAPKKWNDNLFSLAIPVPPFRSEKLVCVEMLHRDEALQTQSTDGRRIYLKSEFHPGGAHKAGPEHNGNPKHDGLIAETVYNKTQSVGLTKMAFAKHIEAGDPPFDKVPFDGFEGLFRVIEDIARNWQATHDSAKGRIA